MPYDIDPDKFTLEIKGKVDRPLKLSLKDIRKLKAVELVAVNQCSGNSRGFFNPRVAGGQLGNGAMGNARWRGVPLKAVLDMAGVQAGAKQVTFNGMDGPVSDKTPDFVKALDIDHARDGEVMLAYGMNGEDLPLLNGFPLRLVVPGYYGTYWVKHLNEITVIDNVFDGFWMKSAYRIPDTPSNCVEPGTAPKATIPINRFTVRSFITNVADGAKLKPGSDHAEGHRLRRRQGHQGSRGLDRRRQDLDAGKARQGSRQIFVPRMEAAGEARGRRLRAQGARHQQWRRHAADGRRSGIRPAICATSSKPFASRRREGNDHANTDSPRPRHRACRKPRLRRRRRSPGLLHASRRNRRLQAGRQSRRGAEQLHRLPLRRLHQDPAARRKFKKDFWAAEVTKMIKVYGAPIDDADVGKIVDYLTANY